jgi:hypothetical protein
VKNLYENGYVYTSLELRAWKSSQAVSASQKKGAPVLSTRKRLLGLGCRARSCQREDEERAVVLDMHIANEHMSARSDIFNSYFPVCPIYLVLIWMLCYLYSSESYP